LEEFVEFRKRFRDNVGRAVIVFGIVNLLDGKLMLFSNSGSSKEFQIGCTSLAERGSRATPVRCRYQAAGECPDIPSATWFQADRLLNHEPLRGVHAPEKRQHAIGIFLLQVIIDIEESVGDQFHPQLFDLMNDLKLHFVAIAEVGKIGTGRKAAPSCSIFS